MPHAFDAIALAHSGHTAGLRRAGRLGRMAAEASSAPFPGSTSPMAEPPIRMRVYGLFQLTRKGYLVLQGLIGAVLAAGILWWLLAGMGRQWPNVWALVNLHWILAALLICEAFETYFMLSAFHHKRRIAERERRRSR
jgi:hypothetical protein